MKAKKKEQRLEMKQRVFDLDKTIKDANMKHPNSFYRPGSLKKY